MVRQFPFFWRWLTATALLWQVATVSFISIVSLRDHALYEPPAAYPHLHRLAISLKQSRKTGRDEEGRFFPSPPPPSTPPQTGPEVVHGLFTLGTAVGADWVRKLITCDLPWLQGMQLWVASFAEEEQRLSLDCWNRRTHASCTWESIHLHLSRLSSVDMFWHFDFGPLGARH